MNVPIKCPACKKPIIPKGLIAHDKKGRAYVLCPFANCQAIIYLPAENGNNSNPELKELNVKSRTKSKKK